MSYPQTMPELRALAAEGKNPRVHPNGFIQLDLAEVESDWHASHKRGHSGANLRLHIWNPPGIELPHQETVNEIHDHVFDMRSTIIKGYLVQRLYDFVVDNGELDEFATGVLPPTHRKYVAVYSKASSRLESTDEIGWLSERRHYTVPAGESYLQPAFTLHDTETTHGVTVVTLMEKVEVHEGDATVICPIDQEPDNSFDRASALPEDVLRDAIERSLA